MTMLSDFDVGTLAQLEPDAIRQEALDVATADMPGYSPDAHGRGGDVLPASFSLVWARVAGVLTLLDDPANAAHVSRAFERIGTTEGGRRHADPCLIISIASRESGAAAFRGVSARGLQSTYGSGGLDNLGASLRSGRLNGHHVPAEYLTRWRRDRTARSDLTGTSDEGHHVEAAAIEFSGFLVAYASYIDLQWNDTMVGPGNHSLAVVGTAERYGFTEGEVETLPSLARRIWHALFFGGFGGVEFGEAGPFGARTVLDFFRDNGHPMAHITRIAELPGADGIVSQRRTRAAISVALIAEAMDRLCARSRTAGGVRRTTAGWDLPEEDWLSLVHGLSE